MKNIFRILMAAAVLLTASCAKEDISSTIGGGEVEVTFTANLAGLGTRAIADGNTVDRVYLAIFDAKADTYLGELTADAGYPVSNGLATIPVVLLKDKEYDLVFWAQKDGTGAYTLDLENRQVKANYGVDHSNNFEAWSNNEARDAFFNISNDWTAGKDNTTFELRRPFAQINVGNSDDDVKYAKQNGSIISQSAMTVTTEVYDTIELVNGSLTGTKVSAEFTLAAIPTETVKGTVDPTHDAALNASEEYNYLAMNYLLVNDRQLVDLVFNFTDGTTTFERKYYQVPVQRNYRTNILGQIISSPMDFTVEIKPGFDGDNNEVQIATAADFINAFANIKDGGTVTLQSNINFTEEDRTHNGGTWYEGVYYIGDKSFTIDLNGKTITNTDGAVNDYMMLFKNDGEKANTITFKNGTIDAGTAAYCALCTSTTSTQKITINLDNVNLIGNNSNGAVAKIRGGAELNVNAGTVITGKDSYLCIESWKATVNIFDGAELYQNGTSSYNGCLVGVSGAGTVNVYGGYGKGVKGGFIAMTSGGTINVNGGEWIANTDGTVGDNSNLYVLTAQNNKYEGGYAGPSIINVTGGTLRGGMDAWILNDVNIEKAELNISGGNFNADPTSYVEDGYKAVKNGETWTVYENIEASDATAFATALAEGGMVTLQNDITLSTPLTVAKDAIINLNGKTISGEFAKNSGSVLSIGADASLSIVGGTLKNTATNGDAVINNSGSLVLKDVTVLGAPIDDSGYPNYAIYTSGQMTIEDGCSITSDRGVIYLQNGADLTINGGNISVTNALGSRTLTAHVIYAYGNTSKLTINGGNFALDYEAAGGVGASVICPAGATIDVYGGNFNYAGVQGNQSGIFQNYMGYGAPVNVYGGTYNDSTVIKNVADGYHAVQDNGKYVVVSENINGVASTPIVNKEGSTYTGEFFDNPIQDALIFQNWIFSGDATIKVENKTYGAIILDNVTGSINGNAIEINNDNNSVMILQNVDLTLAAGKKLIKSTKTIYQVFMANITINGVKQTQASIAQYLENVGWYQVVDEI